MCIRDRLDPMQAAEGSFNTRYPHEPNGIKDPEYSIECGVQELKAALISAEVEHPIDMEPVSYTHLTVTHFFLCVENAPLWTSSMTF